MNEFVISADSTVDLPYEFLCKKNVPIVSLSYIIDGSTYKDGEGLTSKEFYDKIKKIDLCLYPAPWWLYNGWGTPKTRAWMRAKGVLRSCLQK